MDNFIHEIIEAYPKESCIKLIEYFENNLHLASRGNEGKLDDMEITLDLDFHNPVWFGLEETLIKSIGEYKTRYPLIDTNLGTWNSDISCQLMKYQPNDHYSKIHCENDGYPPQLARCFAWMIYLNDIREGGGTYFHHQDITLTPRAGNFYIWPAGWTHMHQGVNAPKEVKYIITGWFNFI